MSQESLKEMTVIKTAQSNLTQELAQLILSEVIRNIPSLFGKSNCFEETQILLQNLSLNRLNKQLSHLEKIDLPLEVQRFEIELIKNALLRVNGCQVNAASLLGLKKTTLNAKIKRYKINCKAIEFTSG